MEDNDELEIFRRQWREEVSARAKSTAISQPKVSQPSVTSEPSRRLYRYHAPDLRGKEGDEELAADVRSLNLARGEDDLFLSEPPKEPSSASEHFEQAVKKEAQGSLGDSLSLYRKAYKVSHSRLMLQRGFRQKANPVSARLQG